MDDAFDVIVIGAGLCAAKTFVQCDPNVNIVLLDSKASIGGVWSKESLYEGLKTNNLWGTLDFTDMKMEPARFGVKPGDHVTGDQMHQYLLAYANKWDLLRRSRFSTVVSHVERNTDGIGWNVSIRTTDDDSPRVMRCKKLIVCTGLTNAPHKPTIPGQEDFHGDIIHSAILGSEQARLIKDPEIETVAVLGGGKSAYDAVYSAAKAGKKVQWCIRRSGHGPAWVVTSHASLGPFKAWREKLIMRRLLTTLSPCIWGAIDGFGWLRNFFHSTWLGVLLSKGFWQHLHDATSEDCGYHKDSKLHVLEPEQNPFFYGTASGIYSYTKEEFHSFILSGQVRVHREDISHLSSRTIYLRSGTNLRADAIITATGYSVRPTIQFEPSTLAADLGIPTSEQSLTPAQHSLWTSLALEADQKITAIYPRLTAGPFRSPSSQIPRPYAITNTPTSDHTYTPFRLYQSIAPPLLTMKGDHSIAFVGYVSNIANTTRLEIQCLWTYAYLTHQLSIPPRPSTVYSQTALMSRFCHWRAPYGHGRWYPDLNFDQLPFFDLLLTDLGLRTWRKGNVLRELVEPYGWEDYRGLVGEWLEARKVGGGGDVKLISASH